MRVEWLSEARNEYRQLLQYYKTEVGLPYTQKFASKILTSVNQLERFPEIGVLKYDTLMGKHGFRALFIDQYACVYKIEGDTVYIYHLADARKKLHLPYLRHGKTGLNNLKNNSKSISAEVLFCCPKRMQRM